MTHDEIRMTHGFLRDALAVAVLLLPAIPSFAQQRGPPVQPVQPIERAAEASGTKWAMIICGHPGDEEHASLFAESVDRIREALTNRFGFAQENVWVRFGVDDADTNRAVSSRGPAIREALADDTAQLRQLIAEEDELWVFVIGHAHHAARLIQLNLPGPDVSAEEFAEWFRDAECRRSIFFVTTPLSGYFLKPLAKPGRVVISATEADLEVNATLFHASLARLLESFPEGEAHDFDGDGIFSLFDLYIAVALDVAAQYEAAGLLATEHAQLDDNGDGRGSELQLDYLPTDDDPRPARVTRPQARQDGALARSIDLGRLLQKKE